MADNFDPYYKWLAIPPDEQPPHSYRLLGLRLFEGNADAIGNAADQRMAHVRTFQTGPNGPATQRLLNEIAAARVCLLNPNKKAAYDQQLRAALQPAPVIPPPVPPATSPSAAFLPLATGPPAIALPGMAPLPLPAAAAHAAWPGALAASEREPALDSADPAADGSDDLDADPAELTHVAGRRGAKRQQNSLVLLVPIGIAGLLAIVALLALSGSSQSPMAGPSAAPQEPAAQPEKIAKAHKHARDSGERAPAAGSGHGSRQETGDDRPQPPDAPSVAEANVAEKEVAQESTSALLTPTARKLLAHVAPKVAAGSVEQSEPAGEIEGEPFEEVPLGGALLVGLNVGLQEFDGRSVVRGVQGVYLSSKRIILGEPHGQLGSDPVALRAKAGYAVGAIKARAGDRVDGVQLVFMQIRNDRLNGQVSYASEMLGGAEGEATELISGEGEAAVGIFGAIGFQLDRFGLMLVDDPPAARNAQPVPRSAQPAAETPPQPNPAQLKPAQPKPVQPRSLAGAPQGLPLQGPPPQEVPRADRLAVPPAQAQKEAETLIHSLFSDDYAEAAKGAAQKMALAVKLFQKAAETRDDPYARYVLLVEARDLAARCGDSLSAADAIMQLASSYQVDDVGMTLAAFEKAANASAAPPQFRRKLCENCLLLIDRAVWQEKFDVAEQLLSIGKRTAAKAQDSILSLRTSWRAARLQEQKAAFDAAQEPLEVLKASPDNPQANLAVGRYRCFFADNWSGGLPLLAQGSDAALRAVAGLELAASPPDQLQNAEQELKLADAWYELAKADKPSAADYERRATHWYTHALAGLRGINKVKAEKRLSELQGGRGLKADYFRGDHFDPQQHLLTRIDPDVDFDWKKATPAPNMPVENFCVRWTGLVAAPAKGDYEFTIKHDDGVRIWLDGKLVCDHWGGWGTDKFAYPMPGRARTIRVELVDGGDSAACILKWSQRGGFPEQVVPPEAFWQDQATGSRAFAPLLNPPYPAAWSEPAAAAR